MLTAAVRDLHACYPGRFLTDVRTTCRDLWAGHPHLTPLAEEDPEVECIDCSYPLIDRSNVSACHCLHGFIDFLNERLGLRIQPTVFRGEVRLSGEEKAWVSQVAEFTGQEIPFWIISAGGKFDVTIKWWDVRRYQEVVDALRGQVQFVQVGAVGHYHPKLRGVIDLRGRTNLRELVRLVYHAQGVVCGVTALMHLAAAVESKDGRARPCVVIAGGREPAHWEAYPGHQFISTNGSLDCCAAGGCWRSRTVPLGDGDERDQPEHLCRNVVGSLPACLHLIRAEDVVRRMRIYHDAGRVRWLEPQEKRAGQRGVRRTRSNDYDRAPLSLATARLALEKFVRELSDPVPVWKGRGIVICGGGVKYFTAAYVCIRMLRMLGCELPIELWHQGEVELDEAMRVLVASFGVECVDAVQVSREHPVRSMRGWALKPYALLHSRFQEVIFLDADNVPVRDPSILFEEAPYRATGAIFWPDLGRLEKTQVIWDNCGLQRPAGPEFESGQMVVDKVRCARALRLALWFNEHADFYYQHLHGDKETFRLAFHKLRQPYGFVPTPVRRLAGTMCQHDFAGNRIFQHRNMDKWNLFLRQRRVEGFLYEEECLGFLRELQAAWDGRSHRFRPRRSALAIRRTQPRRDPKVRACLISCGERDALRRETLRHWAATDWPGADLHVELDRAEFSCRQQRQTRTAWLALQRMLEDDADYVLFLEDDLEFNRHLHHNLMSWEPMRRRELICAGLYNPGLPCLAWAHREQAVVVSPQAVFGSQAILLSRAAAEYVVGHWDEVEGMQDIRLSRLAGRLAGSLWYHSPSLVQHVGRESLWGGFAHQASDYDPDWRAPTAGGGRG